MSVFGTPLNPNPPTRRVVLLRREEIASVAEGQILLIALLETDCEKDR